MSRIFAAFAAGFVAAVVIAVVVDELLNSDAPPSLWSWETRS